MCRTVYFSGKFEPVQNSFVDKCPYKCKKERMRILSFFKTGIIVEKYRINFVTFHNGLLGEVNCNGKAGIAQRRKIKCIAIVRTY